MTPWQRRLRWLLGYLVSAAIAWGLGASGSLDRLELPLRDAMTRWVRSSKPQPVANDVVVVVFNDQFISEAEEPLALFHPHLAELLDALRAARPRLVAFDIALPEKPFYSLVPRERPDYDFDRHLLKAIGLAAREFPLVLARTLDESGRRLRDVQVSFLAAANRSPFLPAGVSASGSAVLCVDRDERVRRYPDAGCTGAQRVPPLASVMAEIQGNRQDWAGAINFMAGAPIAVIPVQEVFAAWKRQDSAWLKSRFGGQTVLVGTLLRDEDRHLTPASLLLTEPDNRRGPGVILQAQIYRSLMNHGLLATPDSLQVLLAILCGSLFWLGRTRVRKFVALLLFSGVVLLAGLGLLLQLLLFPTAALLLAGWLAFLWRGLLDAVDTWSERQHLQQTFSGYASPQLMRRLCSGEISPDQGGAKTHVCVLFADIRGFTALSENLPPEQVITLLNEYFSAMTAAIHRHGGIVDKFIGDGIMALFGQPEPLANPEQAALEAGHEMLVRLARLNAERFAARGVHLEIGIGIHGGDAVLGFVGSRKRYDFTAIGDTVNTASRIEGLSRAVGHPIVCSAGVAAAVGQPDFLVDLGEQAIKGHSAIRVFGWTPDLPRSVGP